MQTEVYIDAKPIAFMLSSDRYTTSNLVELLMERLYCVRVDFQMMARDGVESHTWQATSR